MTLMNATLQGEFPPVLHLNPSVQEQESEIPGFVGSLELPEDFEGLRQATQALGQMTVRSETGTLSGEFTVEEMNAISTNTLAQHHAMVMQHYLDRMIREEDDRDYPDDGEEDDEKKAA